MVERRSTCSGDDQIAHEGCAPKWARDESVSENGQVAEFAAEPWTNLGYVLR
jgi:hypothetical protein